ncbi:hypothetical protein ACJIZ3_008881 [Penstemon smallii]|uniref:Uncharacterized protein n=1 Tax=Penstemon smallii TaxID=265156 RepID=A0ABD3TCC0_9LAMI
MNCHIYLLLVAPTAYYRLICFSYFCVLFTI